MATPPTWIDLSKTGKVKLNALLGDHKGAVGYAYTAVESPVEQAVEIRAASPNAVKLFLNGREIYACEDYHRNGRLDNHIARVTLKAGRNEVLVKLCQNEQKDDWAAEWAFQLRICDALGGAAPLTVLPPPLRSADRKRVVGLNWGRLVSGLAAGGLLAAWLCLRGGMLAKGALRLRRPSRTLS
jgi:hypothetical protein